MKKFGQKQKKIQEITPEELETITVMTRPEMSEEEALRKLKEGGEVEFVLTRHNIYLTKHAAAESEYLNDKPPKPQIHLDIFPAPSAIG